MQKVIKVTEQEMFDAVLAMLIDKGMLTNTTQVSGKIKVSGVRTGCLKFSTEVYIHEDNQ